MKTPTRGRLSPKQLSAAIAAVSLCMASCDIAGLGDGSHGRLSWHFSPTSNLFFTKAAESVVDTNNFILDVRSASGDEIYSGPYHDSPESVEVPPGEYVINARSIDFAAPQFSMPQFGDEQAVVVEDGKMTRCTLNCGLINCGIRLRIGSSFRDTYPDGTMYVESADGSLEYTVNEKRVAYFRPGPVSVVLSNHGRKKIIYTRELLRKDILTVGVSTPPPGEGAGNSGMEFDIVVDTTMTWIYDAASTEGGQGGGSAPEGALSVGQAVASVGEKGVWVYGYIVGGDLTKAAEGISFKGPFSSRTNIAIAERTSVSSKSSCLSVQLSREAVRSAVNLADHPALLGRMVWLKGDIVESYFGIPGLKNVTEYVMDQ